MPSPASPLFSISYPFTVIQSNLASSKSDEAGLTLWAKQYDQEIDTLGIQDEYQKGK